VSLGCSCRRKFWKVRATAQRRLDGEGEAVIEKAKSLVAVVVAELPGVAVLVADQRVEETRGQRVVAAVALHC
jgi:hypothetical protein